MTKNHKSSDRDLIHLSKSNNENQIQNYAQNTKWTQDESAYLFKLIKECNYFRLIHSNKGNITSKLSELMTKAGYKKTKKDIRVYWDSLKTQWDDYTTGKVKSFLYADIFRDFYSTFENGEPEFLIIKADNNISDTTLNNESEHSKRWVLEETECVLEILEQYGIPNQEILPQIVAIIVETLKQRGYQRYSEQVCNKIKQLKSLYNQVERKTLKSCDFPFYKQMKSIIQKQVKEMEEENYIYFDEDKAKGESNIEFVNLNDEILYPRKRRPFWTTKENGILLDFIESNKVLTGRELRRIINRCVEYLWERGYKRTPSQILIRWKNLKSLFWSTYRRKIDRPEKVCSFYYRLNNILNPDENVFEFKNNGIESTSDNMQDNDVLVVSKTTITESDYNTSNSRNKDREEMNHNFVLKTPQLCTSDEGSISYVNHNMMDSIDYYCLSLSSSFKRLDAKKQAKLKIEIQKLMYNAEFDPDF